MTSSSFPPSSSSSSSWCFHQCWLAFGSAAAVVGGGGGGGEGGGGGGMHQQWSLIRNSVLVGFLLSTLATLAFGAKTSYYFSSTMGDDSLSEQQAQKSSTPWKSLSKAARLSLRPGDNLLLCRGDAWFNEKLEVYGRGTPDLPVVVSSYTCNKDVPRGIHPLVNPGVRIPGSVVRWVKWAANKNVLVADLSAFIPRGQDVQYWGIFINDLLYHAPRIPNYVNPMETRGSAGEFWCRFQSIGKSVDGEWEMSAPKSYLNAKFPDGFLNGSRAIIRRWAFDWGRCDVKYHKGASFFTEQECFSGGAYFEGPLQLLDAPREAFFDNVERRLYVYPIAEHRVSIKVIDLVTDFSQQGVLIRAGSQNIIVENLRVEKTQTGMRTEYYERNDDNATWNVTFRRNVIQKCWHGVHVPVPRGVMLVEGNDIGWMIGNGIHGFLQTDAQSTMSTYMARRNVVHHVGYICGWSRGIGIYANNIIGNVVYNVGWSACYGVWFSYNLIQGNIIYDFCRTTSDGAGVYIFKTAAFNGMKVVRDNYITEGYGNELAIMCSLENGRYEATHGIYLDGNATTRFEVVNNTIMDIRRGAAIRLHRAMSGLWADNFVFNSPGCGIELGVEASINPNVVFNMYSNLIGGGECILMFIAWDNPRRINSRYAKSYVGRDTNNTFCPETLTDILLRPQFQTIARAPIGGDVYNDTLVTMYKWVDYIDTFEDYSTVCKLMQWREVQRKLSALQDIWAATRNQQKERSDRIAWLLGFVRPDGVKLVPDPPPPPVAGNAEVMGTKSPQSGSSENLPDSEKGAPIVPLVAVTGVSAMVLVLDVAALLYMQKKHRRGRYRDSS
ncbi:hypothetical protein CBR_g20289 [Chara braunii]|uniref:Right handed beta helix domain-containing protein n=1 Tax=Chara braunii TaxID=69332 RepID=A0A388L097_CHABU|nr:hypothetical protein CBR_g20289 [Chara braunii]|eukprot:GBG75662.1 hypothetical protein CBR_g20289 [Chara braunii]